MFEVNNKDKSYTRMSLLKFEKGYRFFADEIGF